MTDFSKIFRSKLQTAKRIDDYLPSPRLNKKKNQRKVIQELIHDRYTSPVKLESSEGKDENSEGKYDQILTYEIVSEFMSTRKKLSP